MKNQSKHTLCYEVEIHYKRPLYSERPTIKHSKDTEKYLRAFIHPKRMDYKEFVWVMLLSNANKLLGIAEISSGTSNASLINFKEIMQLVVTSNASAIILAHNHPSGKLKPSLGDIEITQKCTSLLNIMNVTLVDHIILTSESYYSFAEEEEL